MCITYIYYTFFYKQKYNKETQTSIKTTSTILTQTDNNKDNNNVLIQTELNMENLMDNNEDWYKLVWTNSTSNNNDHLIDFKY